MRPTLFIFGAAWIAIAGFAAQRASGTRTFDVDPAASAATIEVGKSGALSFIAGHSHEVDAPGVRGTIRLAGTGSEVDLTVPVTSMTVSGAHESPSDRPKIQQTMMGAEVLDASQHPTVTFKSTSVAVHTQTPSAIDAVIDGQLTIRDATRPVSVTVHVALEGQSLTATGRLTVRQTDYGIKPVSVGGVVAVNDELTIAFHVVGRERGDR
jgi:polyisoprenoid-binding protein YceI